MSVKPKSLFDGPIVRRAILDSFRNRVKFGLMTFDGVGTTIGGETLVPWTDWSNDNNPAFVTRANGAPGMFSYGHPKRLSFPGCPTDYGINASESYAAFQLGGSAVVTNDDFGMLRLGLAGSYGKLQFDPNAPDGFSEGNINVHKYHDNDSWGDKDDPFGWHS